MRAKGAKLELVIPKGTSDLINALVGSPYGQDRAEVARYLLLSAVVDRRDALADMVEHQRRSGVVPVVELHTVGKVE